ncbi:D-alanyl-D-alanine carboxypeptidase [Cupriavidus sp. H19C3]
MIRTRCLAERGLSRDGRGGHAFVPALGIALLLLCVAWVDMSTAAALTPRAIRTLDAVIDTEIAAGHVPGAVILIGDADNVLYRRAAGERVSGARAEAMTLDTVFDLASLTKPVATTTAILQLVERGRLALDAPASSVWPAFGQHGKEAITVRQLLTHTSGLQAGVSSARALRGGAAARAAVLRDVVAMAPRAAPGSEVIYSDINFVVLGELVARVSGMALDAWSEANIFAPLQMRRTGFHSVAADTAPTVDQGDPVVRGTVQDPIAAALGGVSGNAGLFATAADLAIFARMLLREGAGPDPAAPILSRDSVQQMITPATLEATGPLRSLGWSIEPPLVANRYRGAQAGMIAHLGYTGTGLWIDLATRRYVIVLSSRLYAGAHGDASPLRANVLGALASDAAPLTARQVAVAVPTMAPAIARQARLPVARGPVLSGIDVLASMDFAPLAGKRIALVTNRSGFDRYGRRTIDVLAQAPGVGLVRIFAPEHGLDTDLDTRFGDTVDGRTGLPVRSLYRGEWGIPKGDLADVDALVFDIQDAGVRFFTYIAMLGQAMESAAAAGIPLFVLDRPNPLGARDASGPVSDAGPPALTAYHPLALTHGMTVGELARMFNAERSIGADVRVIRMRGYQRNMSFEDTGLGWIPPSPNLPDTRALAWYPDVALVEGAAVSVGRGTRTPFAVVGAPWIRPEPLASLLQYLHPLVTYTPVHFVPTEGTYAGELCAGVRLAEASPALPRKPGQLGLALVLALQALDPVRFRIDAVRVSVGSDAVWQMLRGQRPLAQIQALADAQAADFARRRAAYLLY